MTAEDIYAPGFVRALFDEMSATYDRVNYVSSFGFSERWRAACIGQAAPGAGDTALDLMTGMGAAWPHIVPKLGPRGVLIAIDFSHGMLAHARERLARFPASRVQIVEEDALSTSIGDASVDRAFSLFGLKTLNAAQTRRLAGEIARVLKPSGRFSLIEISVPKNAALKFFFLLYLKRVIPAIGRVFLGNPDNYRMLGIYTERFGDCREAAAIFREAGLEGAYHEYFFGCATGFSGGKRASG